jgi:hypothetical protein
MQCMSMTWEHLRAMIAADIPDSKGKTATDLPSRLYFQKRANIMRNYHINCGDNH